jgi:asparagine synthase (glutamine-hydrolysing)
MRQGGRGGAMPGINFVQRYEDDPVRLAESVQRGTKAVHSLSWHTNLNLIRNDYLSLDCHAFTGYPIFFERTDRWDILLEGAFYTIKRIDWREELAGLAAHLLHEEQDPAHLARWLLARDGDYVIWLHDRHRRTTVILNDVFGRLPLYYSDSPHQLSASRDIRFVLAQHEPTAFDPLSLAHFMLLGHSLAEKTPFRGVHRLSPGTLLRIRPERRAIEARAVHTFDFSALAHERISVRENAHILSDLFTSACRVRSGRGTKDIVSLSGGLDSRAVAAAWARNQAPCVAATFDSPGYTSREEVRIAAEVARCLNIPWVLLPVQTLRSRDALELLRLKSGMSPLYMGFILPFFKMLNQTYGTGAVYFTGDGGDQYVAPLLPPVCIPTGSGLCDAVLQEHWLSGRRLGLRRTAELTGIDARDLRRSIVEHLLGFPEPDWSGKWLHYQFYGTIAHIYFEAEDRNRSYFWSTSPFYSNDLFLHAINIPQPQKSRYRLYRRVLEYLSPALGALDYSGYHAPVGSPAFWFHYYKKRAIASRPTWTLGIKKALKRAEGFERDAAIHHCILRQADSTRMAGLLNMTALMKLLQAPERNERAMILLLFNTLALIEDFSCGRSALEAVPDTPMAQPFGG